MARSLGNYATIDDIAEDVKKKFFGNNLTLVNMIYSRNRFAMILRGIARGIYKKGAENVEVANSSSEVVPIIFATNTNQNVAQNNQNSNIQNNINNIENYGPGAVIPNVGVEIGVAPWQ